MKMYSGQIEYNLKRMKRSSPSEEFFKAVKDNNFLQLRDLFIRNIGHDIDVNAKDKVFTHGENKLWFDFYKI